MQLRSHCCSMAPGSTFGSSGSGEQKHVWFLQGKLWPCSVTLWGITHLAIFVNWGVVMM